MATLSSRSIDMRLPVSFPRTGNSMGLILDARSSAFWVLRVDSCSCLCSVKRARLVHTCSGDDERLIESSTEIVASYPFIGIEDRALMLHYPTTVSDEHYIISAYISRNTNDIRETFALILLNFVHSDRLCPCLLYTSPSPRDRTRSRMPSSA